MTSKINAVFGSSVISLESYSLDYYSHCLIWFRGVLYIDGNDDSKGFDKKSEGGVIADLPDHTILTENDLLVGIKN